jgi:GPH family glycoside/pentoside/hexuronide:cation symporter
MRETATTAAMTPRQPVRLPTWLCLGYGAGMIGGQIFRDTPALLLLPFLTNTLEVPAAMAGLAIFIPKFWVVFADPLAGIASDRIRSRWGRRRPFMLVGGLLTVATFVLLFHVPGLAAPALRAAYVCAVYTLALTAFSAFSVPYLTMGAEMTPDTHERTRLMGFRVAFMATGLIVSGYAGAIRELGGPGAAGYALMAWIMGALCLVTMMTSVFTTARAPYYDRHETTLPVMAQFRLALENRPFLLLLGTTFLERLAEGTGYATLVYFQVYVLKQSMQMLGTLVLFIAVPGIVSQPLWVAAARRFGKRPTFVATLTIYCAVFALWLVPRPDQTALILLLGALNGLFNSAFILTALSMLTDAIAYDRDRTGLNREGAFVGVWLANEKVAFAVGTLIVGGVLAWFGYAETTAGFVAQSPRALTGITVAYVALPIVFHLASLGFLLRYRLPPVRS